MSTPQSDLARLGPVALFLKGYPRLSETFIAQEIEGLEARGLDIRIVSLRRPYDDKTHPVHARIKASVSYLPEYLHEEPVRVLRGVISGLGRRGFLRVLRTFLKDLRRDPTRNRLRRFGQALVAARELPHEVRHLHAHFIHTPASVARYAAHLTGRTWSISAHAKDIWTTPDWDLADKLAQARFCVTCTAMGRDHLTALAPPERSVALIYHGLDMQAWPPGDAPQAEEERLRFLCVGRAVAKKGLPTLLEALARLPRDLPWSLEHWGGGPMLGDLKDQAAELGIAERIAWRGKGTQSDIQGAMRRADVFVLLSEIAEDGDRDGLPNVLLEAASQRLACVASDLPGIAEFLSHEETGLLVPPADPSAAAAAFARLKDTALRRRMGEAAFARLQASFRYEDGLHRLAEIFTSRIGEAP